MSEFEKENEFSLVEEEFSTLTGILKDGGLESILKNDLTLKENFDVATNELESFLIKGVDEYLVETNDLVTLHQGLQECDNILGKMEGILKTFEYDLREVSHDIQNLQIQSKKMTVSHTNRVSTHKSISNLLDKVVIPPNLIHVITLEDPKEDGYITDLETLNWKAHNVEEFSLQRVQSALDVSSISECLTLGAVRRARDTLLRLIFGLRRPMTNIQILQTSILIKYSYLNQYLFINSPATACEVRDHYTETVTRIFTSYFRSYATNLTKLGYNVAFKDDLLGMPQEKKKASYDQKQVHKNRASVFSLSNANVHASKATPIIANRVSTSPPHHNSISSSESPLLSTNRATILFELESTPSIIPHVAIQHSLKYPYEYVLHSLLRLLIDTACSEHIFNGEFFPKALLPDFESGGLFKSIFSKILQIIFENLQVYLNSCHDCLGLLILLGIVRYNHELLAVKRKINIPPLEQYLMHLESQIFERMGKVFEANIESVKNATSKSVGSVDITRPSPHYITRRYAEFSASVNTLSNIIGQTSLSKNTDQRILSWMSLLRIAVERFLDRLALEIHDSRIQSVFLINNYAHIVAVLQDSHMPNDHKVHLNPSDEAIKFSHSLNLRVGIFIEEELQQYFASLIAFVITNSILTANSTTSSSLTDTNNTNTSSVNTNGNHTNNNNNNNNNHSTLDQSFIPIPSRPLKVTGQVHTSFPSSRSPPDISKISGPTDKDVAEHLASEFFENWKEFLGNIHIDVMNYFSNFELGSDILKKVLSQFVLYYKRFEEIHRKCVISAGSGPSISKTLVPITSITYEISKRYNLFT